MRLRASARSGEALRGFTVVVDDRLILPEELIHATALDGRNATLDWMLPLGPGDDPVELRIQAVADSGTVSQPALVTIERR